MKLLDALAIGMKLHGYLEGYKNLFSGEQHPIRVFTVRAFKRRFRLGPIPVEIEE